MRSYAIIQSSEDGVPITYIEMVELEDINQLMENYGIEEWVEKFSDPNYWESNQAMLVEVRCINPKPKKVVDSWEITR